MSSRKKIIILANSIRSNQRCIAGKELINSNNIGCWIRPISSNSEGEISLTESRLQDNQQPMVFDIVEIEFDDNENNEYQPENFFIKISPWIKKGIYHKENINLLQDSPEDLWYENSYRTDRISVESLNNKKPIESLYLIKINSFQLELYTEDTPWGIKHRRRAIFDYKNKHYNLPITDPAFGDIYCNDIPAVNEEKKVKSFDDTCYLCVSLAKEFNGYHYKIVATIIEL